MFRSLREQFRAIVRHLRTVFRKVSEHPQEACANDALARFWREFKARSETGEARQKR